MPSWKKGRFLRASQLALYGAGLILNPEVAHAQQPNTCSTYQRELPASTWAIDDTMRHLPLMGDIESPATIDEYTVSFYVTMEGVVVTINGIIFVGMDNFIKPQCSIYNGETRSTALCSTEKTSVEGMDFDAIHKVIIFFTPEGEGEMRIRLYPDIDNVVEEGTIDVQKLESRVFAPSIYADTPVQTAASAETYTNYSIAPDGSVFSWEANAPR